MLPSVEPRPAIGQVNRGSILASFLVALPLAVSGRQPIADIEGGGECQSMEGSDALSALAEVAIGIAGFAAIALVLSRSRDSLSPDILLVIRTMIVNGVFTAFLALFPWVSRPGPFRQLRSGAGPVARSFSAFYSLCGLSTFASSVLSDPCRTPASCGCLS